VTARAGTRFPRLYLHLFASAACVLPVASYVLATFGWSPADIGLGTALIGVSGTLSSPAWGWLDDRTTWAPRAALLTSAAAAVAVGLTLGRVPHPLTWLALALLGAAQGPLNALLTTRVLESGAHGSRLGRIRAFGSLGWVVGLALAAAALTLWPHHAEWVLFTAALLAVTAPSSFGARVRTRADAGAGPRRSTLPVRAVLGVVVFTFTTSLTMSSLVQFTAGWAHTQLSAGPFLALTPIALSAALELPAFSLVDRLALRFRPLVLAVLACPPLAVATGALALFPSTAVMIGVQPLIAASFALWFVGQSRMLSEAVPSHQQASAQTLGSALSTGCAGLLAGAVGGHIADRLGYGGLFGTLAALSLAGAVAGGVAVARGARARQVLRAGARLR